MRSTKILQCRKHWILIFLIILGATSAAALNMADNLSEEVYVDFHSPLVIREGNIFPILVTIRNLNENKTFEIHKVTILNNYGKIIKVENVNRQLKPIKNELEREKEITNYLRQPEFCKSLNSIKEQPEYQEYLDISSKVKDETFQKSLDLNFLDFDETIEAGDMINVSMSIEVKEGDEVHAIMLEKSVLISLPLPSPPHNSPGWYAGDQHIHSDFGETYWGLFDPMDPLEDMVDAAKAAGLDWVIFTDHSPAFSQASEWEEGYNACTAESTSSFKCLYGQEMSIGNDGWCDGLSNGHYLAHPYTDDNLGWINGYCSWGGCDCRSEQPVIDEINNAGGMGFIAHPHLPETATTSFNWDDWSVTGFTGLEIINGKFSGDDAISINNAGGITDSWTEFLESETNPNNGFVVGIAGSDAHNIGDIGHSFTYCYIPSQTLTTTSIRNAYKNGHCIASTGPFVQFTLGGAMIGDIVTVPAGTNALSITAASNGEFGELDSLSIYVNNQVVQTVSLSGMYYSGNVNVNLDPSDKYVGMVVFTDEINSEGYTHRAYTNPIWVNVNQQPSCVTPTNNMNINTNTTFCYGDYYLPDGIKIISNNTVLDCNGARLFGNSNQNGIWVYQQSGITIKNCRVSDYFLGIYSFSNNLIPNKIFNNTLYDNQRAIVTARKHEIAFNKVYNNEIGGIDSTVTSGTTLKIFNNSIYNNSDGILIEDVGTGLQTSINWNEISNNLLYGNLRNVGSNSINATNNWWGTNNATEISQGIIDFYDDSSKGIAYFVPFIQRGCIANLTNTTWGQWQNISCLPNNRMNQTRVRIQYDSNGCGTIQNQTFYEYRANETCDFCIAVLVNTTWSNWTNIGQCTVYDTQNRSRFRVQYDSNNCEEIQNQTIYEYNLTWCNYCSQNISLPLYTGWSACSNGQKTRTRYFIDYNYGVCCAITGLPADCSINNAAYQNVTETSTEGCNETVFLRLNSRPPSITNNKKVQLDLWSNAQLSKLEYTDNSQSNPRWSTLCRNCFDYNKSKTFGDGNHDLVFRGILSNGQNVTNQTLFLLDSTEPRISTTNPQNGKYTNGSDFYVKYTEDRCQNIKIVLNGSEKNIGACDSGRNIEKYISQNLANFDGTEIKYKFIMRDVANNIEESRITNIKVDTTAPEIINFNVSIGGRYAYFNITVIEVNFDSIKYIDNSESNPRWKSLCTSLNNNVCYKKVSFGTGPHSLIIRAVDKAGNFAERQTTLNI